MRVEQLQYGRFAYMDNITYYCAQDGFFINGVPNRKEARITCDQFNQWNPNPNGIMCERKYAVAAAGVFLD